MGKYLLPGNKGTIDIIAGEYKGIRGPAFTFSEMSVFNAYLKKGSVAGFSFPEAFNTGFLVVEGEVKVNNSHYIPTDRFILFGHEGTEITIEALEDSIILILSGEPLNEPITSYGPFVMNTSDEIKEAYEDYYAGKFGNLED
jgi:redox-sensitive bicupin YhaK (pirin superfamily)